ncbi:MAG: hypothetical protein AVDCRST_MAG01-01-3156, partial [uncultured Rubrobacteraceae bacterium]
VHEHRDLPGTRAQRAPAAGDQRRPNWATPGSRAPDPTPDRPRLPAAKGGTWGHRPRQLRELREVRQV